MKYLVGNRGSGVTDSISLEASKMNGTVIVPSVVQKTVYEERCKEYGIKCPRIITFKEFLDKGNSIRGLNLEKEKVYIDGLGQFLKTLGLGNVITVSDTVEENRKHD